ncbi:type II secretion system protein N [uncultured Ramlibacter sp.]|uniref:type II secretion system protein N n=1 Tax=uncultured Ramlibacter sp. TaxID=260755 RepID=UPI002604BE8F|nr:type II secretion system protein N [uncultured Ramlibacter sp.]
MLSKLQSLWVVRGASFLLWALVAGSAVFWALRLAASPSGGAVAAPLPRAVAPADAALVARLLGASAQSAATAAPVASLASRFALVGVVAGAQRGAALIAVDGKPARPFRVGSQIDEGLWLLSVQGQQAALAASANGPAVLTLELPALRRR